MPVTTVSISLILDRIRTKEEGALNDAISQGHRDVGVLGGPACLSRQQRAGPLPVSKSTLHVLQSRRSSLQWAVCGEMSVGNGNGK